MFNNVTSRYDLTDATWEIIIMLLVAFLLGFLLRHLFCCKTEPESTDDTDGSISRMASYSEPEPIDDLKIVEGIGPKIESLLHAAGIRSMRNLANAESSVIKIILNDAGPSYTMHDPKTWSTQAKLIVDENWDKLKEYQDYLKGGRDT